LNETARFQRRALRTGRERRAARPVFARERSARVSQLALVFIVSWQNEPIFEACWL